MQPGEERRQHMSDSSEVGRYRIQEKSGGDRCTEIFRAIDTISHRPVLLYIVNPGLLTSERAYMRFLRDMQPLIELVHPHLAWLWEVGEVEDYYYLVERFVGGPTLQQMLAEEGPLDWKHTLDLAQDAAQSLDFLHSHDRCHGGLQPDLLRVTPEAGLVLTRIGLYPALSHAQDAPLTALPCTDLAYLAPELWQGQPASPASDQYALACLLVEMLTGETLFTGESLEAVKARHLSGAEIPQNWPEEVPPETKAVLLKALDPQPGNRFNNSGEFVETLSLAATEAQARLSPEEKARREAAALARRAAQEQARQEAERQAAIDQARSEIEENLRREAEELARARREAQEQARQAEEDSLIPVSFESTEPVPLLRSDSESNPTKARLWPKVAGALSGLLVIGLVAIFLASDRLNLSQADPTATSTPVVAALAATAPTPTATTRPEATATATLPPSPTPTATLRPTATQTEPPPSPTASPTLPAATVNLSILQLRSGPSTFHPMIARYPRGTLVKLLGKEPQGKWLKVQAPDGMQGWMEADLLLFAGSLANIPTVEATPTPPPTWIPSATPRPVSGF